MNRIRLLGALALLAPVLLPATAQAHDAAAVPACDVVTITGRNFLPGPNVVHVRVTSDDATVLERDVEISNGEATPVRFDAPLAGGPHQVAVELSWSLSDNVRTPYVAGAAQVTCPTPEPPATTTTSPSAPSGPPADVATGPSTTAPTAPRVTPQPRKRNSNTTCEYLVRVGAGPRWIKLFDCPKPDRCPRLRAAVAAGAGPKWRALAIARGCIVPTVPADRIAVTA